MAEVANNQLNWRESESDVVLAYLFSLVALLVDGPAHEAVSVAHLLLQLPPDLALVALGPVVDVVIFALELHLVHLRSLSYLLRELRLYCLHVFQVLGRFLQLYSLEQLLCELSELRGVLEGS